MSVWPAIAVAVTFCWLGMVLAISFIEAPLKFSAPGVTLPIGLGIGRLVFQVLNIIELCWAAVLVIMVVVGRPSVVAMVGSAVAVVILLIQLLGVRPRLTKRSDKVLAGEDAPRSRAHLVYVGAESIKVIGLIVAGVAFLA